MISFGWFRRFGRSDRSDDADRTDGGEDTTPDTPYSKQFKISLESKGRIGESSYELWLTLENLGEKDAVFTSGAVALWRHYGNWVAGLCIKSLDPLPSVLKSAETAKVCIHKGNALPTPNRASHSAWMHGDKILVALDSYADFHEMMKDPQLEIEAQFRFRTTEPDDPKFPSATGGSKRGGAKGYPQRKIDPVLAVTGRCDYFLGPSKSKTATEWIG